MAAIGYKSDYCKEGTNWQCWALPQIDPLIRKLQTQGFGLRICKPISYRKRLRICGKELKIYRKSANQQHHWDRFFAVFKNIRFYDSMYRHIWVDVFIKYNTPLQSSSAVERLFFMSATSLTAK